jgi:hypothetical protein
MKRIICILILGVLVGVARPSFAQRPMTYRPARPAVSPYLNLLRRTEGGLPSYYAFVRPLQQQQATNQQQAQLLIRQDRTIEQLRSERIVIGEPAQEFLQGTAPTGSGSSFMVTGRAGGYFNYSHYYPVRQPRGRRR